MDIITRMAARGIWVNDLLVPGGAIRSVLTRYVDHLAEYHEDPIFKVSLGGSMVLLHYRNRYFGVCCNHQLRDRKHQEVCLFERAGEKIVTSGGVAHFTIEGESDSTDLAVFNFTDPCLEGALSSNRFFEFRELPPSVPSNEIVFTLCAGFPSKDQRYELEDKNHLGSIKRIVVCTLDGQPSDPALIRLAPMEPLTFDPDGMSGGSAFTCIVVGGEFRAYFSGVIARAGKEYIHIIKAGYIKKLLDVSIDTKETETKTMHAPPEDHE